jgi:hypothetical protein
MLKSQIGPRAHSSPTILVEESAENVTVDLLGPFDKPLRINECIRLDKSA